MLESHLSVGDSSLLITKRVLSFDHTFYTTAPGSDMAVSTSLIKNSWMEIRSIEVMFNYAQAPAAGFEYYTNSLNYSGSMLLEILDSNTLHSILSLHLPVRHNWRREFTDLVIDSDNIRSVSFNSANSNFVSYKEGVANISSTIDKLNLLFIIELTDYPKSGFYSDGSKIFRLRK